MAQRAFALRADRPVLSEADVARQIKDFLALRNWVLIRCHVGTFVPLRVAREAVPLPSHKANRLLNRNVISACEEGTADLMAVHPTIPPIWIETKRRGAKLRPAQKLWLDYMVERRRFHGGHWNSIDSFIAFYRANIESKSLSQEVTSQ